MGQSKFEIDVTPVGCSKLEVDGEDVRDKVLAFTLFAAATEPTSLALELVAGASGSIKGEGIVQINDGLGQAVDLLESLKADDVEGEALDRYADEFGGRLAPAIIKLLVEKMREAEPQLHS